MLKKMMMFLVATNVVANRPPECQLTATPTTPAWTQMHFRMEFDSGVGPTCLFQFDKIAAQNKFHRLTNRQILISYIQKTANIGNLGGKQEIGKTIDIGKTEILGIVGKIGKLENVWKVRKIGKKLWLKLCQA